VGIGRNTVPPAVELLNNKNVCGVKDLHIGLNASPDMNPSIYPNADPDSGSAMIVEVKLIYFLFPFLHN
jgi:hypothetical protein